MAPAAEQTLWERYDLAVVDLDGVVYIGPDAVPGAAEAVRDARAHGMRVAFATNNASRPPGVVAGHLRELGIEAANTDVVTSAQAAAGLLAERLPPASAVYVIGGAGLHDALEERGLRPVTDPGEQPVAVVQGYGPQVPWHQVLDGAILVESGLPWMATNTDATVPTPRGPGPGNGALVDLVARFAGRTPDIAGKPEPGLFAETRRRAGGSRPLVIGDRVDTDIDGALAMGWDSLLVMSGVTGPADLVRLPAGHRPTHVAADLTGLAGPGGTGGWRCEVVDGVVRVLGEGDPHQWWQAVALAAWEHLDSTGAPALAPEPTACPEVRAGLGTVTT